MSASACGSVGVSVCVCRGDAACDASLTLIVCWRGERREGFSPYGRGPAAHGANRQRPDHGEECLAPDTGAVLDHTTRNWKKQREGSRDEIH